MQLHNIISPNDNVGFFADLENSKGGLVEFTHAALSDHCNQLTSFMYACWDKQQFQQKVKVLEFLGFAVQGLSEGPKGKNAADIAMTVDAVDSLHMAKFNTYVIGSGDYDTNSLVKRILRSGHKVIVVGDGKAHVYLRNACTRFFAPKKSEYVHFKGAFEREAARRRINEDVDLISIIPEVVRYASKGREMAHLSAVVPAMKSLAKVKAPKKYFCSGWVEFFTVADCCELVPNKKGGHYVRC